MAGEPSSTPPEASGKKPYHAPRLEEYGDVRTVTQSVGMTGAADGGHASMTRTG
jgi:hypothetical protein